MNDFITWCQEKGLDLPEVSKNEDRKRTGAKEGLYPPQYYAGQYPGAYKTPSAADSAYYQSVNKGSK